MNYNKEFEKIILGHNGIKIYLHCCCAVCASFCVEKFLELRVEEFKCFFYNPNIMPREEYDRRAEEMTKLDIDYHSKCGRISGQEAGNMQNSQSLFVESEPVTSSHNNRPHDNNLIICDYDNQKFLENIKGYENCSEGGMKCERCFYFRLKETAKQAKKLGYDCFATTLTTSPHKNSGVINRIGHEVEREIGVKYLVSDFKKGGGFLRSLEIAKKLDLYRQNYCGCLPFF